MRQVLLVSAIDALRRLILRRVEVSQSLPHPLFCHVDLIAIKSSDTMGTGVPSLGVWSRPHSAELTMGRVDSLFYRVNMDICCTNVHASGCSSIVATCIYEDAHKRIPDVHSCFCTSPA